MIVDIFGNLSEWLNNFGNDMYNFVMNNFDQPFFWIILAGGIALIGLFAISRFADK